MLKDLTTLFLRKHLVLLYLVHRHLGLFGATLKVEFEQTAEDRFPGAFADGVAGAVVLGGKSTAWKSCSRSTSFQLQPTGAARFESSP